MSRSIIVDSSVVLTQGQLLMNTFTLTMNNPSTSGGNLLAPTGPFARTNGFLISENAAASVIWKNINTITGYRVVPFGSEAIAAPIYVPFSFTHKSGSFGDVNISTFKAVGNLPWPPLVTHINNLAGVNNAAAVVDRYWMLTKTGANPVADIVFRFTSLERPVGMSALNQGKAQPWRAPGASDSWIRLIAPYTSVTYTQNYGVIGTVDSVRVTNWDWPILPAQLAFPFDPSGPVGNTNPWLISLNSSPCGYANSPAPIITISNITHETCPGSANGAINISVSAGVAPYSYLWNNGITTEDRINLSAGTYTVTVSDANGFTATSTIVINVSNQLPTALGVISGPNSICIGGSFTFVVPISTGATNYQWTSPANTTVTSGQGTNNVIINFSAGFVSGNICVTASNTCGSTTASCLTTSSTTGLPVSPDSVSGSAKACPGDVLVYTTNITANTTSYNWSVPTGFTITNGVGTNNITVTVGPSFVSGIVSVTSVNACGFSPITRNKNITLGIVPSTPSSISGSGYGVCTLTRSYSVTNVSGVSYQWSVPNGASILSGQGTNSVSIQFTGSFVSGAISVVAANTCGNSNARTKTVYGKPSRPIAVNGPTVFCVSDTSVFSTTAVFGNNTYVWTIPSGLVILNGQGSTSITVIGSGTPVSGDVCVKAQNTCGTTATRCLGITVSVSAGAIGSIVGSVNGLCGLIKNYSVANQPGINYNWTVPIGVTILSGQGTYKIRVQFSSSFNSGDIIVAASSPCGNAVSAFKTVNGYPTSPSSITGAVSVCYNAQNVTYSCNTSSGSTSYTWTIPAGTTIVSGQGTNNIVLNFAGTAGTSVLLKAKATNSCGSSANRTATINLNACPRQSENELSQLNLFPNPVKDELNLSWSTETEEAQIITCIDILGQVIWQEQLKFSIGTSTYKIATDQFPSGVYFIRLQQGDKIQSRKFVVRR